MEIMFPDSYISNISERIRLYKELNELQDEKDLGAFEARLGDRFGELPPPAVELFNLVRLRRIAVKMGVERIILKSSLMIIHFTSDTNSGFYSSDIFVSILNYINTRHSKIKVKHSDTRLSLTIKE